MKIALIQAKSLGKKDLNFESHISKIREAAAGGAKIICTQELFLSDYFCLVQDPKFFDLAEKIPNDRSDKLCELCKELQVVLVASLFEDRGGEVYHNTSIVIDADGKLLGKYRKMHIPQDPCFEEKFYFTEGDTGYRAWDTKYGKIGVLICWDQWYPEAARLTALDGAQIIFYPTAIGTLPTEDERELKKFQTAWQTVQRGHGVANGSFIAVVNRVGTEGEGERSVKFWGHSFVSNPYGEVIAQASDDREEILFADIDFSQARDFRRTWPFFRDRRIDSYERILKRFSSE